MLRSPTPFGFRRLLLCLGLAVFISIGHAAEDPLRAGDRIDVTLVSGAIIEYAKVIEVTENSIMVASPQGVREFAAKNLTPDLRARLPGATAAIVAQPVIAPVPDAKINPPAPTAAPTTTAIDLDALAKALQDKMNAQQPHPALAPVIAPAEPVPADNGFYNALLIGLILIIPTLNVLATRSVILHATGPAMPVWILVIWLLPVIGCSSAFAAIGRNPPVKS